MKNSVVVAYLRQMTNVNLRAVNLTLFFQAKFLMWPIKQHLVTVTTWRKYVHEPSLNIIVNLISYNRRQYIWGTIQKRMNFPRYFPSSNHWFLFTKSGCSFWNSFYTLCTNLANTKLFAFDKIVNILSVKR